MFRNPFRGQITDTPTDERGDTAPRSPRTTAAQLPNAPIGVARQNAGDARQSAEQAAERGVASGALDAPAVASISGALPYEKVRVAQAEEEKAGVSAEIGECRATSVVLVEDARRGWQVAPLPWSLTNSQEGLKAERKRAEKEERAAASAHGATLDVLDGTTAMKDGTHRPGEPQAPEVRDPQQIRKLISRGEMFVILRVLSLLLIEGAAVTANMHAYLRADDGNWWMPAIIAMITVGILSLGPFLIGRALNNLVHGLRASPWDRIWLPVLSAFWVATGVLLALVRVSVDRTEAIRAAEEDRRRQIEITQQAGLPTDGILEVDPAAVFDPFLPTAFWITVFIGFGVVLACWEMKGVNPARTYELHARIRVIEAERAVIRLRDQEDAVCGRMNVQTELRDIALEMWRKEPAVIDAAHDHDIAIHHQALIELTGDPAMPHALAAHAPILAAELTARAREAEGEALARAEAQRRIGRADAEVRIAITDAEADVRVARAQADIRITHAHAAAGLARADAAIGTAYAGADPDRAGLAEEDA